MGNITHLVAGIQRLIETVLPRGVLNVSIGGVHRIVRNAD